MKTNMNLHTQSTRRRFLYDFDCVHRDLTEALLDRDMKRAFCLLIKCVFFTITVIAFFVLQLTRDKCAFRDTLESGAFRGCSEDGVESTLSAKLFVFELEACSYQREFRNSSLCSRLSIFYVDVVNCTNSEFRLLLPLTNSD